jgi:DNA-binding TFAR19-related protein (PDSD5 family)
MRIRSGAVFGWASIVAAALLVPAWPGAPVPVTFHDIAPILWNKCAPCHRPGESGPFPLLTYAEAAKRAELIAAVTRRRYMPPWLPEAGYGEFSGELRLTEAQIRLIGEWAAQGAPQGAAVQPPKFTEGWQMGQPDLVLQAPAPYTAPASGRDVYWNFVFTVPLPGPRYVRAVEIQPGDRRLVHHANLLLDRMASFSPSGFPGMDVTILRSPFDPDGHFVFWKPGSLIHPEPDGRAWRLNPGNQLVLNTHIHPSGRVEQIRPSIGLYFTATPPSQFPLLVQLENDAALDIPPGATDFAVQDSFRLPMAVEVLAVYPHAHYLGKMCEAYATLPGGQRRWLLRIPDWDPNWQAVYYYRRPVRLPKGAVLHMRWIYDNSAANPRNPHHPPRRVQAGNQSYDEMAHLSLQLLPEGPGDRRRELQEALMQHRLDKDPLDFEANLNLGAVMLSLLNAPEAVSRLRRAVQVRPDRADAHNMLGLALAVTGRTAEAIGEYQAALRLRPDYAGARFNLANALVKTGHLKEAVRDYRAVAQANPADALVKERLAEAEQRLKQR